MPKEIEDRAMSLWERIKNFDCGCTQRRSKIMAFLREEFDLWRVSTFEKYIAYYNAKGPKTQFVLNKVDWMLGLVMFALIFVFRYVWNILIWIDQGLNVIVFLGSPDETMSSRFGKWKRRGNRFGYYMCKFLNLFQDKHCEKSIEDDEGDRDLFNPV